MRGLKDIEDIHGKRILVRVDFNVPVKDNKIVQTYKIKILKKTIDYLTDKGAVVGLISHISKIDSFKNICSSIFKVLEKDVVFEGDLIGNKEILTDAKEGSVFLFENIRQHKEEKTNDRNFAKKLSEGFDIYVNDAFSVSHREHASISAITEFLPSYAGFLIEKEVKKLSEIKDKPVEGKILILGGSKVDTKAPLIKNSLDKYEKILIGGVMANVFFQAKGLKVGASAINNAEELLKDLDLNDSRLIIPEDIVISTSADGEEDIEISPVQDLSEGRFILDIGPETVKHFSDIIKNSEIVVWNGSLGVVEVDKFSYGTKMVLDGINHSKAESIIGGGDMVAFVEKLDLLDKIDYVSTGGGAMLAFLADKVLPGLKALGYK